MARGGARDRGDRSVGYLLLVLGAGRDRSRGDDPALDPAAARQRHCRSRTAMRRGCFSSARSSAASCRPASAATRRAPTGWRADTTTRQRGAGVGGGRSPARRAVARRRWRWSACSRGRRRARATGASPPAIVVAARRVRAPCSGPSDWLRWVDSRRSATTVRSRAALLRLARCGRPLPRPPRRAGRT